MIFQQAGDLLRDHTRLARTGAGEHETGAVKIADGVALRGVQAVDVVRHAEESAILLRRVERAILSRKVPDGTGFPA
jgi:hypothetical protein